VSSFRGAVHCLWRYINTQVPPCVSPNDCKLVLLRKDYSIIKGPLKVNEVLKKYKTAGATGLRPCAQKSKSASSRRMKSCEDTGESESIWRVDTFTMGIAVRGRICGLEEENLHLVRHRCQFLPCLLFFGFMTAQRALQRLPSLCSARLVQCCPQAVLYIDKTLNLSLQFLHKLIPVPLFHDWLLPR
jgi:hypothetical protein